MTESTNPVVRNALKARNAVRINNIRDFDDLLNGVEEDMNNPGWGWDLNAERKLMAELRPYAQKFDRMSEWESVNRLVAKAKNSTTANAGVARNADNPFKVGDIVTHKSFGNDIKFKVIAVTPDLYGDSAIRVEVYKGGFLDSPVRFKKA